MVTSMDLPSTSSATRAPSRAAQYVHMSTEHQQYSPENQFDVIRQYAGAHIFQTMKKRLLDRGQNSKITSGVRR